MLHNMQYTIDIQYMAKRMSLLKHQICMLNISFRSMGLKMEFVSFCLYNRFLLMGKLSIRSCDKWLVFMLKGQYYLVNSQYSISCSLTIHFFFIDLTLSCLNRKVWGTQFSIIFSRMQYQDQRKLNGTKRQRRKPWQAAPTQLLLFI